jgi:hypothetical protein
MQTPKAKALRKKMNQEEKREYKHYEKTPEHKSEMRHLKKEYK